MDNPGGEVKLVSLCSVPWHRGVQLCAATSDGRVYGYNESDDTWDEMPPVPGTAAALAAPVAAKEVDDTAGLGL